ncbi:pyrrolidone carboxyl peptidase, partial [Lactobacillus sp. XV13L]|nr:pyrrolidone carboxyl peptidase [Lactobacillus sp. XV13L]
YQVQYMIDKEFHDLKAGFMHIPFLPQQVTARPETPSLSLTDDVKGITAAIAAIVKMDGKGDLQSVEGHIA